MCLGPPNPAVALGLLLHGMWASAKKTDLMSFLNLGEPSLCGQWHLADHYMVYSCGAQALSPLGRWTVLSLSWTNLPGGTDPSRPGYMGEGKRTWPGPDPPARCLGIWQWGRCGSITDPWGAPCSRCCGPCAAFGPWAGGWHSWFHRTKVCGLTCTSALVPPHPRSVPSRLSPSLYTAACPLSSSHLWIQFWIYEPLNMAEGGGTTEKSLAVNASSSLQGDAGAALFSLVAGERSTPSCFRWL